MSGTWTEKTIASKNVTRSDDINKEFAGSLGQFNGNLDQHNMPLQTVNRNKTSTPVLYTNNNTTGVIGPFGAHYVCGPYEDQIDFDAITNTVYAGWIRPDDDFICEFTAIEGMLIGSVTICGEKKSVHSGLAEVGEDYWFSFGVFINGSLVGETGKIFARTYTVDLPFGTPIGNGSVQIDVRFMAPPVGAEGATDIPTTFSVKNRFMWARNQYR